MTAMRCTLGVDVGTTGLRAVLVTPDGEVLASASASYPVLYPEPGWAEQDPLSWWEAARQAIRRVAREAAPRDCTVAGLGLTGQMHGAVLLDEAGNVLRPALLWCDTRTAPQAEALAQKVGTVQVVAYTANPPLPNFTATKVLWVRQAEPHIYARIRHLLLPKDYLRYRLTGEWATDVSDASGTLLLDVARRRWSPEMLAATDVPESWLPRLYEGPEVSGRLRPEVARDLGLPDGLPVVAGAGDQAAGAVGAGSVRTGILSVSLGTSGVVFATTELLLTDPGGRLHAFCHAVPGLWHLMGVTQSAGGSLRWLRDALAPAETAVAPLLGRDPYEVLGEEAARVPAGAEGLLFLPYLMGERTPHLDPSARGVLFGLSPVHTRSHLVRAVLEGVAFSLRDCLDLMRDLGLPSNELRATGGGARSPLWRQILADVFGIPVSPLLQEEGPALGAALLAQVGTGLAESVPAACARAVRTGPAAVPQAEISARYQAHLALYRDLYRALRPLFPRLQAPAPESSS